MQVTQTSIYERLSDMEIGQSAISQDGESFFVCGYYHIKGTGNVRVVLDLSALGNQYTDNQDSSQPVKILKTGDKISCTI